jgi:hypothetical protein
MKVLVLCSGMTLVLLGESCQGNQMTYNAWQKGDKG